MRNTQASLSIIPHDAQSLIALSDVDEMSMTETGEIYVEIYVLLIIIIIGTIQVLRNALGGGCLISTDQRYEGAISNVNISITRVSNFQKKALHNT